MNDVTKHPRGAPSDSGILALMLLIHWRWLLIVPLAWTAAACAPRSSPFEVRPRVLATTMPAARSAAEMSALLAPRELGAAEYYMGDRLGLNLRLTLLAGGTYALTWHGCQGLYGVAVGRWRAEEDRLWLEPLEMRGRLVGEPLGALRIRMLTGGVGINPWSSAGVSISSWSSGGAAVLIPEDQMEAFVREGVREDTCFRPSRLMDF